MNKSEAYREIVNGIFRRDGVLRPEALVEEARPKDHPMHKEFEWDDTKCGGYWRVYQARLLINVFMVDVMDVGMAAFEIVTPVEDGGRKGYYPIEQIMSDKDMRKQVLKNALRLIKYWRKKYAQYKELEGIINEKKFKEVEVAVK